jgi:ribosome-binding ATPase YchF (GTP1/OBG family)
MLSSTSWERNATLVKNTDAKSNKYVDHMRQTHDPALHVKTLEDEIRGTMGAALGKQSKKILYALKLMQAERETYDELVGVDENPLTSSEVVESAKRYNQYRQEAVTARWELMVHRQAVGFIVDNHKIVHEKFPIGEQLPVHDGEEVIVVEKKKSQQSNHNGQLDWWQRVGRWR